MTSKIDLAVDYWYHELIDTTISIHNNNSALYQHINHDKLRTLVSSIQDNLLYFFQRMNERLPTGEVSRHYWADESRGLKKMIGIAFGLSNSLKNTEIPLEIDKYYKKLMEKCDAFLSTSNGSDIPPNMGKILLPVSEPIFTLGAHTDDVDEDVSETKRVVSSAEKEQVSMTNPHHMTSSGKCKIFISHASKNNDFIAPFVDLLQLSLNVECLEIAYTSLPETGLNNFSNFNEELRTKITNCEFAIIFLTQEYVESQYCMCELGAIWILKKQCFLFNVGNVEKHRIPDVLLATTYDRLDSTSLDKFYDCIPRISSIIHKITSTTEWNSKKERTLALMKERMVDNSSSVLRQSEGVVNGSPNGSGCKHDMKEHDSIRILQQAAMFNDEISTKWWTIQQMSEALSLKKTYVETIVKILEDKYYIGSFPHRNEQKYFIQDDGIQYLLSQEKLPR